MRRAISCVYCAPKSRMRILSVWRSMEGRDGSFMTGGCHPGRSEGSARPTPFQQQIPRYARDDREPDRFPDLESIIKQNGPAGLTPHGHPADRKRVVWERRG